MAYSGCKDGQCRMRLTGIGRISSLHLHLHGQMSACLHARSCEGTDVGIYDREAGQAQPRLVCVGSRATKRLEVVVVVIVLLLLCIVTLKHGKERHPLHHRHHIRRAVSPVDGAETLLFHCFFLLLCIRPSCLTDKTSCAPAG